MKAIAVRPGQAGSLHLAELPKPSVADLRSTSSSRRPAVNANCEYSEIGAADLASAELESRRTPSRSS